MFFDSHISTPGFSLSCLCLESKSKLELVLVGPYFDGPVEGARDYFSLVGGYVATRHLVSEPRNQTIKQAQQARVASTTRMQRSRFCVPRPWEGARMIRQRSSIVGTSAKRTREQMRAPLLFLFIQPRTFFATLWVETAVTREHGVPNSRKKSSPGVDSSPFP